eukprot:7751-Heterococcus_DN1.PRE.1
MGLSVYDVLTFPAYFSYPLEALIEPRTEFLKLRRRPIAVVGLNTALTSGDADFARKVAKWLPTPTQTICHKPFVNYLVYRYLPLVTQVSPDLYISFKKAYLENRAAVVSGQMSCESVLELVSSAPLGSLGGLSTSSNVSEVFGARQLNDDEVKRRQDELLRNQGLKQQPSNKAAIKPSQSKDTGISSSSKDSQSSDPS